jgi:hypothetical protein
MELDGPKAKYERALEHLSVLDSNCRRFLETKPYSVTADFETDEGGFVVRLNQREAIPLNFSTCVGDVVHNLRSALDHAAWLLACRSTRVQRLWDEDVAWRISFPITKDSDSFKRHKLLPYIDEDAKEVLERLQPYHAEDEPESHSLWRLHRASNIDKHRVLHPALARIDLSTVKFRPGAIDIESLDYDIERRIPIAEPVEDGDAIAVVRFKGKTPPEVFGSAGLGFALSAPYDFLVIAGHVNHALEQIRPLQEGTR